MLPLQQGLNDRCLARAKVLVPKALVEQLVDPIGQRRCRCHELFCLTSTNRFATVSVKPSRIPSPASISSTPYCCISVAERNTTTVRFSGSTIHTHCTPIAKYSTNF